MPETAHTTVPDVPVAHDPMLDVGAGVGGLGGIAALLLTLERVGLITLPRRGQDRGPNADKLQAIGDRLAKVDTRLAEMAGTDALHAHRLDSMQEEIRQARADVRRAIEMLK